MPADKTTFPRTVAEWRRLKLAFAGWLHAMADRIEFADNAERRPMTRVDLERLSRRGDDAMKRLNRMVGTNNVP